MPNQNCILWCPCVQVQVILMHAEIFEEGTHALYGSGAVTIRELPYSAIANSLKVSPKHALRSLHVGLIGSSRKPRAHVGSQMDWLPLADSRLERFIIYTGQADSFVELPQGHPQSVAVGRAVHSDCCCPTNGSRRCRPCDARHSHNPRLRPLS